MSSLNFPLVHQIILSSKPEFEIIGRNSIKVREVVGKENYRLWNSESVSNFLSSFYPKRVFEAFNDLKPFALKADLARYCILHHFGGLYLDLSIRSFRPFVTQDYDMVIFRDLNSHRTSWKVANNLFYSKSNNPILRDVIDDCVLNVTNRYYGIDPHSPTGPTVLGRNVAKHGEDLNLLVGQYFWFKYARNKYFLPDAGVIARHKHGGLYQGGQSGVKGGNNYNDMWRSREIYSV